MKKTLKYIVMAICVYTLVYLMTSFIIWDFDLSVMQTNDRCAVVFISTLTIGAIIYFNELMEI